MITLKNVILRRGAKVLLDGATVIESTRTHIDMGPASLDLLFLADPDGTRIELMETIIK